MFNAGKALSHILRGLGMRLGQPPANPGDEANLSIDRFYFTMPISFLSVPRISVLVRSDPVCSVPCFSIASFMALYSLVYDSNQTRTKHTL